MIRPWLICAGLLCLSTELLAEGTGTGEEVEEAYAVDARRIVPLVRVAAGERADERWVDLLHWCDGVGDVWLVDPFLHAESPQFAMIQLWRGAVALPPQPIPSFDVWWLRHPAAAHGGLRPPSNASVGSRFRMRVERDAAEPDGVLVPWRCQLLLLDGCVLGRDRLWRRDPLHPQIVARSVPQLLGHWPVNARVTISRAPLGQRPQDRQPGFAAELTPILPHDRQPQSEILFRNSSDEPIKLFLPFLQGYEQTDFPGRLWMQAEGEDAPQRVDLLHPSIRFGFVAPRRSMCFWLPPNGICGSRLMLRRPAELPGDYLLELELDRRFRCEGRPIDDEGTFTDLPCIKPVGAPALTTGPVSSRTPMK